MCIEKRKDSSCAFKNKETRLKDNSYYFNIPSLSYTEIITENHNLVKLFLLTCIYTYCTKFTKCFVNFDILNTICFQKNALVELTIHLTRRITPKSLSPVQFKYIFINRLHNIMTQLIKCFFCRYMIYFICFDKILHVIIMYIKYKISVIIH